MWVCERLFTHLFTPLTQNQFAKNSLLQILNFIKYATILKWPNLKFFDYQRRVNNKNGVSDKNIV